MEKNIAIIGIGKQGIKAVGASRIPSMGCTRKIYVDHVPFKDCEEELLPFTRSGRYLPIPFYLDSEEWDRARPAALWISDENNTETLKKMIDGCKILIVAAGLGGAQNYVARELIRFYRKERNDLIIYFVGTLPFRYETSYQKVNTAKMMIDFLRKEHLSYSIIENENFLREIRKRNASVPENTIINFTYSNSFQLLQQMLEGITNLLLMPGNRPTHEMPKPETLLHKGPVYYTEFDIDMNHVTVPEIQNPLMPYDLVHDSVIAQICLGKMLQNHDLRPVVSLHDQLTSQTGEIQCIYSDEKNQDPYLIHIRIFGKGKEGQKRMNVRELDCIPI